MAEPIRYSEAQYIASLQRRAEAAERKLASAVEALDAPPSRSDAEALIEKLDGLGSKTCSKAAKMLAEFAISRAAARAALRDG